MLDGVGYLYGDVLVQFAAESYINQLSAIADGEKGFSRLSHSFKKTDLEFGAAVRRDRQARVR